MISFIYIYIYNRLPDHVVAQTIVAGFTGQLKGWWDNYLTFDDRNSILKAYRINESNEVESRTFHKPSSSLYHLSQALSAWFAYIYIYES